MRESKRLSVLGHLVYEATYDMYLWAMARSTFYLWFDCGSVRHLWPEGLDGPACDLRAPTVRHGAGSIMWRGGGRSVR